MLQTKTDLSYFKKQTWGGQENFLEEYRAIHRTKGKAEESDL